MSTLVMLGLRGPMPSKKLHFALITKNFYLAGKHQDGSKKNCHWSFGSQNWKLRVLGLLLSFVGPPRHNMTKARLKHQKRG